MLWHEQQVAEITRVIQEAEASGALKVLVHVRPRCGRNIEREAHDFFIKEKLHENDVHNDVLIYIGERSKRFVIMGDQAIHKKLGEAGWQQARDLMQQHFQKNEFAAGVIACIQFIRNSLC